MLQTITPSQVQAFTYEAVEPQAYEQANEIVQDIKQKGVDAIRAHAFRLKDIPREDSRLIITPEEMKAAYDALSQNERDLLDRTAKRIEAFARIQRGSIQNVHHPIPGGIAGQDVSPMASAGCYAPGGRYPLPSSVLMTAVTARVAGVKKVIVASPRPGNVTMAAAYVAKADLMLAVGGAQAIAAMAYGVDEIPPCDIIVGPGNKWVTAAKSIVSGRCAIDMLAGPSECLVVADDKANAKVIAADLLAQAEHDVAAVPILVTTSQSKIEQVNEELSRQLATLRTADVARVSVKEGFAVLCPDMDSCIQVTDILAPEHLEVLTENSDTTAKLFNNYGGMFIGERAAEVFGDYGAGPNHVLPTGGTARYTGGLSVHTFLRIRTWMRIDDAGASKCLVDDAAQLARLEGLEGHARAAERRRDLE